MFIIVLKKEQQNLTHHAEERNRCSYGLDEREVRVRISVGSRIFSSPCRSDRLWGPPNLLSNGYLWLFPRE
jgi:hypothetical protein